MKNTDIEKFCDWGIVFSLSALIFILPASIAYLDSFAAFTVLFYLVKKINRIVIDWPISTPHLNFLGRLQLIWKGLAPPSNFLNQPLQLLVIAVLISVIFSQYPKLSLLAFFGKFLKCVFLYFSFIEAINDKKRLQIFLGVFLLSASLTALSGVIQHYTGKDFFKGHLMQGGRVNSVFFTANGLGAYLLPVIGLVAHFLFTAINRHKAWLLGGVFTLFLFLFLTCLCWTYSRSSWIGLLVILISMVVLDRSKVLFAGGLLLVFILIFLPSLNSTRHLCLINDSNEGHVVNAKSAFDIKSVIEQGGSGRHNFWQKAISIIRSSPVFGTGLNTYSRILKRNPDQKTWWYAHNCYLQMAAEIGILGLTCFLWMLFVLLKKGIIYCMATKALVHLPENLQYSWLLTTLQGSVAGLFGYLVQCFFDNTLFTVQLSVLLWMIIGLMVSVVRLLPAKSLLLESA